MKKSLIAITLLPIALTGCSSPKDYGELLDNNQYNFNYSSEHSEAMNLMMKAYNIEPVSPNNLDEFTGDYHSRQARKSNVTGGAIAAMSLLGGAGLGSSLFTGAIHSPSTDDMANEIRNHSMFRVLPVSYNGDLPKLIEENRRFVIESVEEALDNLGYDVTHYVYESSFFMPGTRSWFNGYADLFVRNDLPQCEETHEKAKNNYKYLFTFGTQKDRNELYTCLLHINDAYSRLVISEKDGQQNMNFVWSTIRPHEVGAAWHVEVFNQLTMDSNTYLYTPSFYWLRARNDWLKVDNDIGNKAMQDGVIDLLPRLKVLDGSNAILPFSLEEA
ncbi:hypothetical protein [Photobacterium minamisatsumaniensis]|uniref:hypothetical protein n=1 Tax=Photobacterium minamisatsumaniensis TaxID=2910233 RepID=UPI003D0F1FAD